ncbi:cadual [Hyalella azteca]|uniref:Cadual n=1 Tax=Hyalella azteca TaxID=294128 RepID=A0A6A0GXF0_HYAAZ|nr:cadual [Hyalella azteca]
MIMPVGIFLKLGRTRTRDKYRVVYSEHQRLELEKEYNFNRYITIKRKTELAETLSLSERQIKIWFQNRRAKDRKNTNKKKASPSSKEMPCGGQMTSGAAPPNQHSILGTRLAQGSALPQAPGNTIDPPSGYLIPETSTRMLPSEEFQSQMGLMDGQQNTAPHEHMSPEALHSNCITSNISSTISNKQKLLRLVEYMPCLYRRIH